MIANRGLSSLGLMKYMKLEHFKIKNSNAQQFKLSLSVTLKLSPADTEGSSSSPCLESPLSRVSPVSGERGIYLKMTCRFLILTFYST